MGKMFVILIMAYLVTGLAFGILDAIWLKFAGPRLYRPALGELLHDKFKIEPAAIFYLIYVGVLTWLAVMPGLNQNLDGYTHGVPWAILNGALLGLAAYGAYSLTNHATLKKWSSDVTALDLAWGAAASGLAAGIACFAITKLGLLDSVIKAASGTMAG